MTYKCTRKFTQQSCDAEAMKRAINAVRNEKMPISTSAKPFIIQRNTLKRRVLKKNQNAVEEKKF